MSGVFSLKSHPDEKYHELPLADRIARIQEYYLQTGIYHAQRPPTGKPMGLLRLKDQLNAGNVPPGGTK